MSDNMNKCFDQVAAFQKLWTDSFANMASVWSQFSPGSPPSDEMRKMRGGMLKVLAETWDEYMRTLNGALDLKRTAFLTTPSSGESIGLAALRIMQVFQANRSSTFAWRCFPRTKRIP